MRVMLIDDNNKFIQDEHGQILLDTRPNLGFVYEAISYSHVDKTKWVRLGKEVVQAAIEKKEVEAIERFIDAYRAEYGVRVLAADKNGMFLGRIRNDDPRIEFVVTMSPPNEDDWKYQADSDQWVRVYGFAEDGSQVRCKDKKCVGMTEKQPPELSKMLPCKWSKKDNDWVFDDVDDTQWADSMKREIMFGILGISFGTIRNILMRSNPENANEFSQSMLNAISQNTKHFVQRKKNISETDAKELLEICNMLSDCLDEMKSGQLMKSQTAFMKFQVVMNDRFGPQANVQKQNAADLIIDNYVATK